VRKGGISPSEFDFPLAFFFKIIPYFCHVAWILYSRNLIHMERYDERESSLSSTLLEEDWWERERQRQTETETERDRETERETERERERERKKREKEERERERESERERKRERRERWNVCANAHKNTKGRERSRILFVIISRLSRSHKRVSCG